MEAESHLNEECGPHCGLMKVGTHTHVGHCDCSICHGKE